MKSAFVVSLDAMRAFEGQGLPEIALAGRSNVGKSSLINSLASNSKLARTSSEPGKTRLINMYRINDAFYFADLPGYGYAKAPVAEKRKWAERIEGYLSVSENLKHVFMLVDLRHAPTADDAVMVEYLRHYNLPFTVVATKADKLSKAERGRNIPVICRALSVQPWNIIAYSSVDATGKDAMLARIEETLELNKDAPTTPDC